MITGFNTDIEYEGVTYHIQTEDKGLDTPLILSLVYIGGAILASKRSPYHDLITSGFSEKILTERLHRQHKLICAAVRAGRIEDLKKMGERDFPPRGASNTTGSASGGGVEARVNARASAPELALRSGESPQEKTVTGSDDPKVDARSGAKKTAKVSTVISVDTEIPIPPQKDSVMPARVTSTANKTIGETSAEAVPDGLYLNLLDDHREFRAGESATIRIYTSQSEDGRAPMAGVSVTVKVLGTTFRPIILPTTTDKEGIAVVRVVLPRFTSGRAAILIRAVAGDDEAELRRIIHQS